MKRRYGVLLGLLLLIPSMAWSASVECTSPGQTARNSSLAVEPSVKPIAEVQVGDERIDLSLCLIQVGKLYQLSASFFGTAGTGDVTAVFNTDPFISFGATTTNLVAGPTTFAFTFGTPVVPGFYSSATSTAGVSVTNGVSGTSTVANSAINPSYISGYGTVGLAATNLGVDLGTADCVAGPGTPFTVTTTCDQGLATNSFAPTFYDNLEALLTYTQDDIGSVASWSGAVTLTPAAVPEPTSLALVAMGVVLLGAGGFARRRKN